MTEDEEVGKSFRKGGGPPESRAMGLRTARSEAREVTGHCRIGTGLKRVT